MSKLLLIVLSVGVVAGAISGAAAEVKTTKMQGQMVCMWCDVVTKALPEKAAEQRKCMPVFRAVDGKVYTLVPDKVGNELSNFR